MLPSDGFEQKRRKRLRLPDYDYAAAGAYFVTICTDRRRCIFATVQNGSVALTRLGGLVHEHWRAIPDQHRGAELDALIVMPNHLHAVLMLDGEGPKLSTIVDGFKSRSTVAALRAGLISDSPLWQRSFYDHAIRSEDALNKIRHYIEINPTKWHLDHENPAVRRVRAAPGASGAGAAARAAPTVSTSLRR